MLFLKSSTSPKFYSFMDILKALALCMCLSLFSFFFFQNAFFFFFGLHLMAWGILVPWPEIEPVPPAMEA